VGAILGLLSSIASVIRWGEPWDIIGDDPLLSPLED
jgi:hypothetical protein